MNRPAALRHLQRSTGALLLAITVAACGAPSIDEERSIGPADQVSRRSGVEHNGGPAVVSAGGWLGERPDFDASTKRGGDSDGALASGTAASAMASTTAALSSTEAPAPRQRELRAGSVDDNADYAGFLAYVQRNAEAGIVGREWDARHRVVARARFADGRAASGATVEVANPQGLIATLRATADGTVRFLPAVYGNPAGPYTISVARGSTATVAAGTAPGTPLELTVEGAAPQGPPAVDVLFLLDATGSMGDEIDQLKANIATIAADVSDAAPDADVRFGMTLYRDVGDAFVTATYDFTGDVAAFGEALDEVAADGGDDYPEALDEGLAAALDEPSWSPAGDALQLIFVVGDAPPQLERQLDQPYTASLLEAMERGIKIFPIASSGTDDVAELVFRQMAQATGARFVFLAYGAGGAALGPSSDIGAADYQELSLDALVTRAIVEEIGQRTGRPVPVPGPPTTTTTRPQGQ